MSFESQRASVYLLSIKVKLNMQLNSDIVKSAKLRFTCYVHRELVALFPVGYYSFCFMRHRNTRITSYQEVICNCFHPFVSCMKTTHNESSL